MITSHNGELREQHNFPIAFFIKKNKRAVSTINKELGFTFSMIKSDGIALITGGYDIANIKESQSFYIKGINVSFLSNRKIENIPLIEISFNKKSYLYKSLIRDNLDDRLFSLNLKCEEVLYPDSIIDISFQRLTDDCELFVEFDSLTRYKANI